MGTIYVGSGTSTPANTTTAYTFSGGTQQIGQLRYAPVNNYTGPVEIPYVALNANGVAIASGVFSLGVLNANKKFGDITTSTWCYKYVTELADASVIDGYSDGNFKPNQVISRAEIAVMTNRVLGRTADKNFVNTNFASLRTFSDIPVGYWAYYDILEAANTHQCAGNVGSETWYNI